MRILGIDPGLARVGYGVIDITNKEQEMRDCGVITTKKKDNDGDRMVEIADDLSEIIKQWNPELAAVEKFFFYRSSNTINVLQARGVIIMTLSKYQIPIVEFAPMQIKLSLTGFGKASKSEVMQAVMRELKLNSPPRPDDAADALATALTSWFLR